MRRSHLLPVLLTFTVVGLWPDTARAHDLRTLVRVEADVVRVEARYDDGTRAAGADVQVTDANGNTLASGTLDASGTWSFPRPDADTYTVVVEAVGHRDQVTVTGMATYSRWRLNPGLGLALGLTLLLGGSLAYWYLRRPARPIGSPVA